MQSVFSNTLLAICIEKVVYMKTGEELYCKAFQSQRLPRVVLAPNSYHGRQDPPKSRCEKIHPPSKRTKRVQGNLSLTSRGHTSRKLAMEVQETCRGNVDYRNSRFSSFNRSDNKIRIARTTVKRLIQQFENHPNRDSLLQDLNKTEEINPIQRKGRRTWSPIWATRESSSFTRLLSKKQCPDCAFLFLEVGIIYCTCGKCLQPTERHRQLNKSRYDVLSICWLRYRKRILPMVPDMDHLCGRPCTSKHMICWAKPANTKSGGYRKTILERLHDDGKYRKSLSDIGWTEEQIIQCDAVALEDHSYVATTAERSRNEKSWKFSFNREAI